MITCSYCIHQNPDSALVCEKCGSTLTANKPVASSPYSSGYSGVNNYEFVPKKKHTKLFVGLGAGLGALILGLVLVFTLSSSKDNDTYTKSSKKDKKTVSTSTEVTTSTSVTPVTPTNQVPDDDVTVLIYMIGANLDRDCQAATTDIEEMKAANFSDNINVVVEAGGTTYWANDYFTDGGVDRAVVSDNDIQVVEHLGTIPMTIPSTLTDFLVWGAKNYPAKKYHLVLWDHGGGVVAGFGTDENYPNTDGLYISDIANAIGNSGIHFDLVSYNACLMATVENAYALSPYADYMIASEESVYALAGLNYTSYLNVLAEDATQNTLSIARSICDAFMYHEEINDLTNFDSATISVIDLSEIPKLIAALGNYFGELRSVIQTGQGTSEVIAALQNCKTYGDNGFDEVDLISFLSRISSVSLDTTKAVREAFFHSVVYRPEMVADGSSGLSIYIPYHIAYNYGEVFTNELRNEGITDANYLGFIDEFGGKLYAMNDNPQGTATANAATGYITPGTEVAAIPNDLFWRSYDAIYNYPYIADLLNGDNIPVEDETLLLSQCDLGSINNISSANKHMYLASDFGYLADLGTLPHYQINSDYSTLGVEISTEWYEVEEYPVPYYYSYSTDIDGQTYEVGYIPALRNYDQDIILLCVTEPNGYASAIGFYDYSDSDYCYDLEPGDIINFTYDIYNFAFEYYTTETDYSYSYVVDDSCEIVLTYDYIDDDTLFDLLLYYEVEDLYGNMYYTDRFYSGPNFEETASDNYVEWINEIVGYMIDFSAELNDPSVASEIPADKYDEFKAKAEAVAEVVNDYQNTDWALFSQHDLEAFSYAICQMFNGTAEMLMEITGEDFGSIGLDMDFFY